MGKLPAIALLLIGFSIFYYLVIFLPNQEKQRVDWQEKQALHEDINKMSNGNLLQSCLNDVQERSSQVFEKAQSQNLSNDSAKVLLDEVNRQKEECFKRYPQNR